MKDRQTNDRRERQTETRHCDSCNDSAVHLVWVLATTVERKCMGCGKLSSSPRKAAVLERAAGRDARKAKAPSAREEHQARNALEKAAAKLKRKGKRGGWAFSTDASEG